jgi:conjugal transfer pilus assembly protein TraB
VLLRVKKEAILPNRYRADVRECFLIAAGWGDLGSERAYLRGERLSCIREDGTALETKIDMYAVGEDGKAGVRGRLVSKTGALLSKALLAGFMEGFSQLFSKQPVMTIQTGTVGRNAQAPFQSYLSKDALQSAGLEGAGSALERLSKYYIDMAKDIFPVIEIDAGRAVDFVLISGISLKLQGTGAGKI